ncbi:MAG: hypothetical protein IMY82_01565 [Chloroflexi bacterium]|nr:hypothetical protein [Chloroflexota bacterium]
MAKKTESMALNEERHVEEEEDTHRGKFLTFHLADGVLAQIGTVVQES